MAEYPLRPSLQSISLDGNTEGAGMKPSSVLACAKYACPEVEWVKVVGLCAYNKDETRSFDLTNTRDIQALSMKLKLEKGWDIRQDNHGMWIAKNKTGGEMRMASLPRMLGVLVGK